MLEGEAWGEKLQVLHKQQCAGCSCDSKDFVNKDRQNLNKPQ